VKYCDTLLSQKILLIDADLYLYRACAAAEEEVDWGDDLWSLQTDLKEAKAIFQRTLQEVCEALDTANFILCFSDRDNFRKEVLPSYKGGRKKVRKPCGYKAAVQWARDTYLWHSEPMLEADDVMGILATAPDSKGVIVSDDKDMLTLPAKLYRPQSGEHHDVSVADADRAFLTQSLTGDPTDGYTGVPRVGAVTAAKILGVRPAWSAVVAAYVKAGLTEADAIQQARCARILRFEDWDQNTSTIKLWEPPSNEQTS
jgi:DNA polymerase I